MVASAFLAVTTFTQAAFLVPNFSGNTSYDGWDQLGLSAANNPGFPTIVTGADPWPNAVGSNVLGSSDAEYIKLSGEGFPSNGFGGGTYVFTMGGGGGTGGSFQITDNTPVSGLETVLFQIDIEGAEANWTDFLSLTLNYNGGSQALVYDFQTIFPTGAAQSGGVRQIVAFQWDLSSLGSITSFEIVWNADEHSFFYGLQLDESDIMVQAVPESSVVMLLLAGSLFVLWRQQCRIFFNRLGA